MRARSVQLLPLQRWNNEEEQYLRELGLHASCNLHEFMKSRVTYHGTSRSNQFIKNVK